MSRSEKLEGILAGDGYPPTWSTLAVMDAGDGDALCLALMEAAILPRLRSLDFSTRDRRLPSACVPSRPQRSDSPIFAYFPASRTKWRSPVVCLPPGA